jgi:hypothetical protein
LPFRVYEPIRSSLAGLSASGLIFRGIAPGRMKFFLLAQKLPWGVCYKASRKQGVTASFGRTHMRKTLLMTAICIGLGFTLPALADDTQTGGAGATAQRHSTATQINDSSTDSSTHSRQRNNNGDSYANGQGSSAANNGGTASSSIASSFNTNKAIAISRLDGVVTDIRAHDIGNVAWNTGNANGGRGGSGGDGSGGWASGGRGGSGGDGGNARSRSGYAGGSGADSGYVGALSGAKGGDSDGDNYADARARSRGASSTGGTATGGNGTWAGGAGTSGAATASSGAATSTGGSSGAADSTGGMGGAGGSGASGTGGEGLAGSGGAGGAGGSNMVDAGTFDMSNHMEGAAAAAAGVTVMAQNSGVGSLIQQSVNVQANLNIGP